MTFFIIGSSFIVVSQTWKLWRGFSQKGKSWKEIYDEDPSGVWVDFFAGAGGLMYFSGTFVLRQTDQKPELMSLAALIYSFGGLFFFTSAAFMQKRYFWEKTEEKVPYLEE